MKWVERLNGADYLVVEVDASKCISYKSLYHVLDEGFSFPQKEKVKNHGDVLLDHMRDLAWCKERNFKLIITNRQKAEKVDGSLSFLLEILEIIKEYWDSERTRIDNSFENHFLFEFE